MRMGPPKTRGERADPKGAARGEPPGSPKDLRPLLRRHVAPADLRWAGEEAFRVVLAEANRQLAGLLRDVRRQRATGRPAEAREIDRLLKRVVRCAVQQYTLQAELGTLALTDGLTGLCNRRGFLALAERHLRLARRAGRRLILFFVDMDGLKDINDAFGHAEGDRAIRHTAEALERTFRDSDILGRFGGDEFAALAIEAADYSEPIIQARIRQNLEAVHPEGSRYALSVSVGAARFEPESGHTVGQLLVQADRAMYQRKRRAPEREEHVGESGPA